jgi:hypothetical protein
VAVEDKVQEAEAVGKEWEAAPVVSAYVPNAATGNLISEEFPALKKNALSVVLR